MSKSRVFILILAVLAAWTMLAGQSQDWNWVVGSSGDGAEYAKSIATDPSGNTLLALNGQGNCGFGALTHSSPQYLCVVKADPEGNWLWLQYASTTSNLSVEAIAADAAGNSYIAGSFSYSATFGSTNLSSAGGYDAFVAKLDSNGNWLWARKIGDTLEDRAIGLALDSFANVYITGSSNLQMFISVWSSAGAPMSGAIYTGTAEAVGMDIALDASGSAYVAGYFSGSVTFGATTLTSAGSSDIFVVKITSTGTVDWARRAGGSSFDIGCSLALDSVSSVYVTGSFRGTADFGPNTLTSAGLSDIFVSKLGSNGAWLGTVRAGGMGLDEGRGIAVESASAIYLTGHFSDTATFGSTSLTCYGYKDIFVGKVNSAGTWFWAKKAGSTGSDTGLSIALDATGGLRVGGEYSSEACFGSQTLPDNDPGAYNYPEVFLAKIGEVIPLEPENLTVTISGNNAVLTWNPVTLTVFGQTVTPDEYVIYYTANDEITGPYTELARTAGTSYTHLFVVAAEPRTFYRVSAVKY